MRLFSCPAKEKNSQLFIVVMLFDLNDKYGNSFLVYVIDDSVVSRYVTRIGNFLSSNQRFRVSQTGARMLHDIKQYLRRFPEQLRIGLFPFLQSSLRCF